MWRPGSRLGCFPAKVVLLCAPALLTKNVGSLLLHADGEKEANAIIYKLVRLLLAQGWTCFFLC